MIKRAILFSSILFLLGCAPQTAVSPPTPIPSAPTSESDLPPTPTLAKVAAAGSESAPHEATSLPATETALPSPSPVPPLPTATDVATAVSDFDEATLTTQLITLMTETLQAEKEVDTPFAGYEGMVAFRLPVDSSLWLLHSVGFRAFDPHFVTLFLREDGAWQELGRESLEDRDLMWEDSVTTIVGNGRLWVELRSGIGAHGGCYNLLRVENHLLTSDQTNCNSFPDGANQIIDLNADGFPDLILDFTNSYVFCYACGVRFPEFGFKTWNGTFWEDVQFTTLVGDAEAVILNNQAVALAQAGLWKEAAEIIASANSLDPDLNWNRIMINRTAQAHIDHLSYDLFPLLQLIFYGDYEAALSQMRPYSAAELFDIAENPMIIGTAAEGWPDALGDWMLESINPALAVRPEWATAYFLRGWAAYQIWDTDPAALADIEQAARLAPDEPLFVESAAFLRGE